MRDAATRRILLLSLVLLAWRAGSLALVSQPGYTDSYYYAGVAERLARGDGLTADFVWSFLEAPGFAALPIPSHRFWMPLTSVVAGGGMALLGPLLGPFRAGQLPLVALAAFLPWLAWRAARSIGAGEPAALVAAAVAGLGGLFAPAFVALDGFALAALLGTLFFLAYARAAAGGTRAAIGAGLACGLLFLTRAEGALFGLALLALLARPASRRAGIAGSLTALAIGLGWLGRGLALGGGAELLARSALLVRYEEFFALGTPEPAAFIAAAPTVIGARAAALASDAVTFAASFLVFLVPPLLAGIRGGWRRPEVRAWVALAVGIYLAEGLVWTLHATRGSYFHSLAALFPTGVALAVTGAARLLAPRGRRVAALAAAAGLAGTLLLSAAALLQWEASFGALARARAAAVTVLPAGPILAIDAAAWHWLAARPALVTPADGLAAAACVVRAYGASAVVLEAAHFGAYDELYRGGARPAWLGAPRDVGDTRVFPVVATPECAR